MNRQRLILFVLAILFCAVSIWSYSAMPRLKSVDTLKSRPVKTLKAASQPSALHVREADDGTKLKLDLLEAESSQFKGYRRNIFAPLFVDEVKVAKQARQQIAAVKQPAAKTSVPASATADQQVVIMPETAPLARFTFLGFLKKGTAKTIFLAKEKDILLVKIGDKVAGRYEATDISDEALTLTVTDTGDEIVIPLIENRPLAAAK